MSVAHITDLLWRSHTFGQAVFDLARATRLSPRIAPFPVPPREAFEPVAIDRWFEATAEYFGTEIEATETTYADVENALAKCAPCLLRIPVDDGFGVLAILESNASRLLVLRPGNVRRSISTRLVAEQLRAGASAKVDGVLSQWTSSLPVSQKRREKALRSLQREVVGDHPIGGLWVLRPPPGSDFGLQLRHSGDIGRVVAFLVVHALVILFGLLGWSSLFEAATNGKLESSALGRWVLLTLSVSVLEIARSWIVGRMNVSIGALLKRRVLSGALRLDTDVVRLRGSGGLLALINESEVLENAGIGALLSILSACISLVTAASILYRGAGGLYHVALLVVWAIVIAVAMAFLTKRSRSWTNFRVEMTNKLVERMVGNRTRMVQEQPIGRHSAEDAELELYLEQSRRMDALSRTLQGLPSRGWLALGFAALIPALWAGTSSPTLLLLSVGGMFTAQGAFSEIAGAISSLVNMHIAWNNAGDLFRAAARVDPYGLPSASVTEIRAEDNDGGAILEARGVSFRYAASGEAVLDRCSLRVSKGERVLLEGPSGGGKSTLAALLAGLRDPTAGLVLHHGIDRATLGTSTWRKKIASVPQFHENHILSSSLLFNLLLGRRWPATKDDRDLAEKVCKSLGLGPLIERMPAGLEQVVGETGWQLSHGERTRIFLARALLQDAELLLVDESFGALDPHSLRVAMDATLQQAPSLVVIAHP